VTRSLAAVAALLLLGSVTACAGGQPQQKSLGTIVFTSDLSGREGVYAIRPDGRSLSRLLAFPSYGANVIANPAGTMALVVPEGKARAYLLQLSSGRRERIRIKGGIDGEGAPWSPDGKRLLLTTNRGEVSYDLATRRATKLDVSRQDIVAWTSNSRLVLDAPDFGRAINLAPVNGGSARPFARAARPVPELLTVSADGKWIGLETYAGGENDRLYVQRRTGKGLRLIARDPDSVSMAWSPSGDRLAFGTSSHTGVVDMATGHRTVVTTPGPDPSNNPVSWSPDGRWLLYWRNDLDYGALSYDHLQLWAMRPDGSAQHAITHDFTPDWGEWTAQWVAAPLHGTHPPRLPLVSPPSAANVTTELPVVALGARGNHAAVATGFGSLQGVPHQPRGPIVLLSRGQRTGELPVRGCHSVDSVFVTSRVGYVCDNGGVGYLYKYAVRLGLSRIAHTFGGEFEGSYLSGVATDGRTVAFGVELTGPHPTYDTFRIRDTRIYRSTGARPSLVRELSGAAKVESVEGGRIAVLRGKHRVTLVSRRSAKTVRLGGRSVVGVALDGPRLIALEDGRLVVLDAKTGRQLRALRTDSALNLGAPPQLGDVHGELVAFVVGAAVHVMRLSDGREIVLDTPGATAPVLAAFGSGGLFYAYNEAYAKHPGRVGFVTLAALEHAISAHGRQAR
jgi:WD40 repeat protein